MKKEAPLDWQSLVFNLDFYGVIVHQLERNILDG